MMTYNRIVGAIRMRTVRSLPNIACPGATASLNKRLVMNSTGHIYHGSCPTSSNYPHPLAYCYHNFPVPVPPLLP